MNAPLQGTAADMLKLAMIKVDGLIRGTGCRMLLNVHDELVFEMPEGDRSLAEPIRNAMETALPLNVSGRSRCQSWPELGRDDDHGAKS